MTARAWVDALGAGAAQLVFSTRPATGAVLLLAVAVVAPVAALTALTGLAAATGFAVWSRWNRLLLQDGVFGYNGVLLGLLWPAIFVPASVGFWLLLPAAIGATALLGVLLPPLSRRDLPVLGIPFLAVAWAASAVGSRLGWRAPVLVPPPTIAGPGAGWHDARVLDAIASAAPPLLVAAALVALAIVLDSRARLGTALLGAGAGLAAAIGVGGAEGLLWIGAVVYNAVPTALGVGVSPLSRSRAAVAAGGATLAALVWALVTPRLLVIGLFPLTAPMHVVLFPLLVFVRRGVAARRARAAPDAIDALAGLLRRSSRIVALTGAGVSTESGIPDYRSQLGFWFDANGDDLLYDRFLHSEESRRLYWRLQARFARVLEQCRPNAGHLALARLEREGRMLGVITQNVDGLHQQGGSSPDRLVELHGSARWVVCIGCRRRQPYRRLASRAATTCEACGGILKTETVSFGEPLAADRLAQAAEWSESADLMLLLGSSSEVEPARSLPALARARGIPLVVVNRTETPWDPAAALVIRADVGLTLAAATARGDSRRIRMMTSADFAYLCGVVDVWWGDHVRYLLHPIYMEHFGDTALVLDDENGLAGFLLGFVSQRHPEEAYVHMVGVAPDRRGRGVGRALYERFVAVVRARGCRRVVAITVPYNAGSIAFHRAFGFKLREEGAVWEGELPVLLDYAGPGVSCVVMRLDI